MLVEDIKNDRVTEFETDLGRAAVLLHDIQKYGQEYTESDRADRDHDLQAAQLVRDHSGLDDRVSDAIAAHMGPWYEGPSPSTPLEHLVHAADMAASSKNGTWGVYRKP
ncbi:HD domain-containing protein [Haloarchaeobius sp. HRN-SO-5]|uniref:HD domain-containing protein n=1 Tax=Haloarchaeobius sp. HRN-SO-5 TaxID=3446118 RepID=UPI003EC0D3CF